MALKKYALAVLITLMPALCDAACLSYSSRIYVTGRLDRAVAPGPPNYESIARGDKPEIFWAIRFNRPVCVDPDPTDEENPGVKDVREIQLVLMPEQYRAFERMLGQEIRLSGTLFPAHTGHHHTSVLLENIKWGE